MTEMKEGPEVPIVGDRMVIAREAEEFEARRQAEQATVVGMEDPRPWTAIQKAMHETGRPHPPTVTTVFDYAEAYAMGGNPEAANAEAERIEEARQKVEQAHATSDTQQDSEQE